MRSGLNYIKIYVHGSVDEGGICRDVHLGYAPFR